MVSQRSGYQLVQLVGGAHSVHSLAHRETFHPVIGPVAEAEALYVRQLDLPARVRRHEGEFVIWDVGLGAAANALTVLRATREIPCAIRLVSFDHTLEPLQFALQHADALGYFGGYETHLQTLLTHYHASFQDAAQRVDWDLHLGDFPTLLSSLIEQSHNSVLPASRRQNSDHAAQLPELLPAGRRQHVAAPHAILFDAYSPAKNPAMWSAPLFTNLFKLLDPERPCAMPTYSRSTMLRVTLLLSGFFVGAGHATGEKEETTIAANTPALITEPLDAKWLERVRNSTSAEPLWEPVYRQARLSAETWEKLRVHPQFSEPRSSRGNEAQTSHSQKGQSLLTSAATKKEGRAPLN